MTNIEDRLGQLSTTEETEKVKAELAELGKKQLGLAEEIRRLKQQQPGGSDSVKAPLTLGARVSSAICRYMLSQTYDIDMPKL